MNLSGTTCSSVICNTISNSFAIDVSLSCILNKKMEKNSQQFQSAWKHFNDFSYRHYISHLLQLSQIHNIIKIHSVAKNVFQQNVFTTKFERNCDCLRSESFSTIEKLIKFQEIVINRFQYFNFETGFLENENIFQKTWLPFFSWKH